MGEDEVLVNDYEKSTYYMCYTMNKYNRKLNDLSSMPLSIFLRVLCSFVVITCFFFLVGLTSFTALALEPDEIVVVTNGRVVEGVELAHFYMKQRRIPDTNLVKVHHYPVEDWLPNPYFLQFQQQKTRFSKAQVLMVARLDGPDPATVKRIIVDSLAVERKGLTGTAYFDARWPWPPNEEKLTGYRLYDKAIHQAAESSAKVLPTVLNDKNALFQPGEAPQATLYCGWYSLAQYIDAFSWKQSAIAYHIASAECSTLKKRGSQVWCKRLLEDGVAATIGPVGEPYVQAFPFPQLFFSLLLDGDFTLVEAYQLSLPFISWKMVLIGDPLYQPFRQRGILP